MHLIHLPIASLITWIVAVAGEANLLTFVNGGVGNVLGTAFGAPGTNATFDYVIVGGGTAGLTIATRLAEDPAVSVAVVEAGGFYEIDNGNRSVVPGKMDCWCRLSLAPFHANHAIMDGLWDL